MNFRNLLCFVNKQHYRYKPGKGKHGKQSTIYRESIFLHSSSRADFISTCGAAISTGIRDPSPETGHSPYGHHYGYDQSPPGYPPQPGYGAPQYAASASPQQQQQVVVVGAGQWQQPLIVQEVSSYVRHIIFSCIVAWLCCWVFGLIAFILSG